MVDVVANPSNSFYIISLLTIIRQTVFLSYLQIFPDMKTRKGIVPSVFVESGA